MSTHKNPNSSSFALFNNSADLQHRIHKAVSPSVLQVLPTRTLTVMTSSTNLNNNNNSSAAGNALAAIRKNNNNNNNNSRLSTSNAQASPELIRNWREPFQALQRLEERAHRHQLEESKKSVGAFAFSSESQNNIVNNASSSASSSQFAKKFGFLPSRMMAMQNNSNNSEHSGNASDPNFYLQLHNSTAQNERNDPMAQLDRLYSKAKRKWVDLCVTLRVPEEERKLIENQISQRDDLQTMNTALEILHSEIERLIEMYHWGGVLRKSIEEREKFLVTFLSFLSEFSLSNSNFNSVNGNSNLPPVANLELLRSNTQKFNNKQQQSTGRSASSNNNNNNTKDASAFMFGSSGETCLRLLERMLQLRYLTADVFTAHRKWQVTHGSTTNPTSLLFVFKGSAYLEKMMQDISSVIDTDGSDMDRAIQREQRRAERIQKEKERELDENFQLEDEEDNVANNNSNDNSKTNSGRVAMKSSLNRKSNNNNNSNNNNSASPNRKNSNNSQQRKPASTESFVIRELPDWLFSLTIFRISRQNPLIDTRKRRSLPMFPSRHEQTFQSSSSEPQNYFLLQQQQQQKLEAAKDFDDNDIYQQMMLEQYLSPQVQQLMEKSDQVLSKLLFERCGWTIDDYFLSASRSSLNDEMKSAWRREAQSMQQRINDIAPNPSKTGAIRSEFLRDLEAGCNFVVSHEQAVVDSLVERSIQQGMYGDQEQQQQFSKMVETLQNQEKNSATGLTRKKSSIRLLMEASQMMMMKNPSAVLSPTGSGKNISDPTIVIHPQLRALLIIQKAVRCFLARKVARTLWHEKMAATAIQSWIRRFLARCRIAKIRRRSRAASRIQAFYRASVVRREIAPDLQRRRAIRDARLDLERQNKIRDTRVNDQVQYQTQNPNRVLLLNGRPIEVSVHRSVVVGKSGKSLREYLAGAATKIQAAYRGHVEYRYGMGAEVREWRMFWHIQRAAAKIQALARGVAVRKELVMVTRLVQDVKMLQRVGRAYLSRWKDLW